MLAWIARGLRSLAFLFDSTSILLVVPKDENYAIAVEICKEYELDDKSDEWKRHQVYARLIKDTSGLTKRQISLLIEAAL